MQLGVTLPVADIGTGPTVVRDYAQAAEGLGYSHLLVGDHVLGANPAADRGVFVFFCCGNGFAQRQLSSCRQHHVRLS